MVKKLLSADLFCGCGGFSEGLHRAGFETLLAADFEKNSCNTLKERLVHKGCGGKKAELTVIQEDLTKKETAAKISQFLKKEPDLLVAGIPCQSFSIAGRAQDKFSMKKDERNYLYKSLITIIRKLKKKPKVIIIENVKGILSAKPQGERIVEIILKEIKKTGYKICGNEEEYILDAQEYGVAQRRKRVFLICVRKDLAFQPETIYEEIKKNKSLKIFTVKDAIKDLPKFCNGYQSEEIIKWNKHPGNIYLKNVNYSRKKNTLLFNHVARKHNPDDRKRFRLLSKNGWKLKHLLLDKKLKKLVHHDPLHFEDRYRVQKWDRPGGTIVSHLHKDGNLFIHPDYRQERTFTVREAARIQSFPDDFFFTGPRTEQYKQVGNAVPPLLAYIIGKSVKKILKKI